MTENLQSLVKSAGWPEAKEILLSCVDEERKSIVYQNIDNALVGQEYKALRRANNIITRAIVKIESAKDLKELKPIRVLR